MTDRELLEAAAKAAGYKIDKSATNGGGANSEGFDLRGNAVLDWHNDVVWNPLENDGDALRLAVKLEMHVNVYSTDTRVTVDDYFDCEYHNSDSYTATRRAIVKAAAAIGKQT